MAQNLTTLAPKIPRTFPGITGGLVGAAQQGSPEARQYTAQTAQYGAGNLPIGSEAADIAKQYGQKIADVGQQGAAFRSGQLTTGTSPVAEGNAAVTAQNTAGQQQALATGEEAALQGTGQQLAAQQQAANAANAAAGQAYTGQGQKISGLTSAAGVAAPQLGSIAQIPFSPLSQGQGAPLGSEAPGGILGAARLAGQVQGAQAEGAAPGLGAAAGTQAVAAAPGQAQASNIQTGGTAQTGAYNTVYQDATQNAAVTAQLQSQIRSVGTQALDLMKNNPQINQFALQFGNKTINNLQAQLSNPQYAAFGTVIQALQARISQALSVGEIPTAATANAQAIANGNITLGALGSTLSQVDSELSAFNESQNNLANYAKSQMQGSAISTGVSTDTSGYNSW